jgi:hypothetical protein
MKIQDCADTMSHPPFRALRKGERPPGHLIDVDGVGIYLHGDSLDTNVLAEAARIFGCNWRDIDTEIFYFRPVEDSYEWFPAPTGRFPRFWRLNLPYRWAPQLYMYCKPRSDSEQHDFGPDGKSAIT